TYQVLLSYMKEIARRDQSQSGFNTIILGEVIYVFLIILSFTVYLTLYRKEYFEEVRAIVMLYALIILPTVMASLLVSHNMLHVYILPFVIAPIFIRVFMDSRTAFMAHTSIIIICACMLQKPLEFVTVEMAAGLAAILSLREMSSRSQLFWTAVATTIAAMLTNFAIFLIRNNDINHIDNSEYIYLAICGIVIFCSYPLLYLVEKFSGFISDITLIELSDMNKDLLRRMSEVAPGTFQHSIQVGNLAAEIARRIGANPQLVRTGALYHDIGKMQNPIYFTENQSGGINPHDQLSYIESAQMIISHVTEGLKLADKNNLPVQIRDLIATHHGQGKAKYFYIKYKNEHPNEPVDDLLFTYPGPNPFTKEQAILMMADAVEAASRSLPDYTEQSIRTIVGRIIDSMVEDGFFRECPITFRDIQYAKTVLIEKLKTIYHTRISYPEMKK
ncbi:MAG: HDIG domain-containing protein, partial [Prevotella sp.]|nr:HDIG domain-containing protein [Prevotella sp.]